MSESGSPDPLDSLGRRIAEQQRLRQPAARRGSDASTNSSAVGFALRIGTELVAALLVGLGIGWLLDRWLGTRPWLMVLFVFLGIAAGMINVYREITAMGRKE